VVAVSLQELAPKNFECADAPERVGVVVL
jgi:hypothetical protein